VDKEGILSILHYRQQSHPLLASSSEECPDTLEHRDVGWIKRILPKVQGKPSEPPQAAVLHLAVQSKNAFEDRESRFQGSHAHACDSLYSIFIERPKAKDLVENDVENIRRV
jgi:hypothetical protein